MNVKNDFPIFTTNKNLIYLDSTATTLKPKSVIEVIDGYYIKYSANVFRGVYKISEKATDEYEKARDKIAQFINAKSDEIVFVRNASEACNLVSYSWAKENVKNGDEIITTIMEHHSNFVPWQQIAFENKAIFTVIDVSTEGILDTKSLINSISSKTKLAAITHVSNVLGTINPVKEIIKGIRKKNPGCIVFIDGAQAVPHMKVDVTDLDCDFYCFSGHKMLGPTGIGVLWGKRKLLANMKPFNYGGEMIQRVTTEKTEYKEPPYKFEAGTPHIAGAIGLGAAVDYLTTIGMDRVRRHEIEITSYALEKLSQDKDIAVLGPIEGSKRGGVIAFTIKGIHPHDIASILDQENICIRSGNHCAMPLHNRFSIPASARISFYIYTTKKDIDKLIAGISKVKKVFTL